MTTLTPSDIEALPALPRDEEGPVFAEPWQAQAFALAASLREDGVFTWSEWCTALNREILAAQRSGDPDLGDTYYEHWLRALQALVVEKGLLGTAEIERRHAAWERAHRATPHGEPVLLDAAARRRDGAPHQQSKEHG